MGRLLTFFQIFLVYFLVVVSLQAKTSFQFKSSLWAYEDNYIIQFEPSWLWEIETKPGIFKLEIGIPVFFGLTNYSTTSDTYDALDFYLPGFESTNYHSETWPRVLSDPLYLLTYLNTLEWSSDNFKASYSGDINTLNKTPSSIIWFNPFLDSKTGMLNRYVTFQYFSGSFYTSSLTDPGLFYTDYEIILGGAPRNLNSFWDGFVVYPLAWVNIKEVNNPDYGGGMVVKTGRWGNEDFAARFQVDSHILQLNAGPESVSYRLNSQVDFLFKPVGFSTGYVYKSSYHPFGPFLSPLFVSRQTSDYSSFSKNHGISLGIIPGIDEDFYFSLITEIYPENNVSFSLRAQIGYKWDKSSVQFGYIHENMENSEDFLEHQKNNTFVEFDFSWYLIPGRFLITFKEVLCFDQEGMQKTIFSITSVF
jgi:hypothetical protein